MKIQLNGMYKRKKVTSFQNLSNFYGHKTSCETTNEIDDLNGVKNPTNLNLIGIILVDVVSFLELHVFC